MTPVGDYGQLLRLDRPVIATGEAAAVWQTRRRARADATLRGGAAAGSQGGGRYAAMAGWPGRFTGA